MGDRERPDPETVGAKPAMRMERQRADGGSDECPEGDEKGGRGAKSGGEPGERPRIPANRDGRSERPDQGRRHERERKRQEPVVRARRGQREKGAAETGTCKSERGLGATTLLAEPGAGQEEQPGAGEGDRDARHLADPAVVDRECNEEGETNQDGKAADDRKQPSPEELLEVELVCGGSARSG